MNYQLYTIMEPTKEFIQHLKEITESEQRLHDNYIATLTNYRMKRASLEFDYLKSIGILEVRMFGHYLRCSPVAFSVDTQINFTVLISPSAKRVVTTLEDLFVRDSSGLLVSVYEILYK